MRRRASIAHAPAASAGKIRVRHCHTLAECERCLELQRESWGFEDKDAVPVPLFVVAIRTGGQVLGAFDGDRMIGFTLAVAGWRDHKPMLHSHMTAVLEGYRNHGVGGHLKVLQRAGLITQGRAAQWRPCRLEATPLKDAADWLEHYRRFWNESFDRLGEHLRELQRKDAPNGRDT